MSGFFVWTLCTLNYFYSFSLSKTLYIVNTHTYTSECTHMRTNTHIYIRTYIFLFILVCVLSIHICVHRHRHVWENTIYYFLYIKTMVSKQMTKWTNPEWCVQSWMEYITKCLHFVNHLPKINMFVFSFPVFVF